jgi:hypothetical protein
MKYLYTICVLFLCIASFCQSVGIGTTTPHPSAILDVSSSIKGFLMPRMTTAQRDAIVAPAIGLQIYNTDDKCIDLYNGIAWTENCALDKEVGDYSLPADIWRPRAEISIPRYDAVGFAIGSKGYIGTGHNNGVDLKDFWEYDPDANTWTQKADFGGTARFRAVGFSIGTKGYIGTGKSITDVFRKDFWEYDPTTNVWTQKADIGSFPRDNAVGFSIGTKGYLGLGYNGSNGGASIDFYEYDPTSNTWTQKANFSGSARYRAVGLSIGQKGYIGTGQGSVMHKDFYEYDPSSNQWTQKADFGGTARHDAVAFTIGSKGYIGTGKDLTNTNKKDFWEYDPSTNAWTQKANLDGEARFEAVGFSIGTKGYIGTGYSGDYEITSTLYKKDFWEYNVVPTVGKVYAQTLPNNATKYVAPDWTIEGSSIYQTHSFNIGMGTDLPTKGLDINGNFAIRGNHTFEFGSGFPNPSKIGYQSFSPEALDIVGSGTYPQRIVKISDGVFFENILANRKLVLSEFLPNDHQFYGLGIEAATLRYQVGNGGIHRFFAATSPTSSNVLMTIFSNGNLSVAGSMTATAFTCSSDARLKKNIVPIASSFSNLFALNGYTYNWKERQSNQKLQSGFLAQDVQKLLSHLVKSDEKGMLSINYLGILPYMLAAMQEMKKENETAKIMNEELKQKYDSLKQKREQLQKSIADYRRQIKGEIELLKNKN